jgi:hypothetical protein
MAVKKNDTPIYSIKKTARIPDDSFIVDNAYLGFTCGLIASIVADMI